MKVAHASAPKADSTSTVDDGVEEQVVLRVPAVAADSLADICDALDASSALTRTASGPYRDAAPVLTLPPTVSVLSYAVGTLDLASIFMAVVAEEDRDDEGRSQNPLKPRRDYISVVSVLLCGWGQIRATNGDSVRSSALLPVSVAGVEPTQSYEAALAELCASRPAQLAGLLPFMERFVAHSGALLRRRLATSRRDLWALLIQVCERATGRMCAGLLL